MLRKSKAAETIRIAYKRGYRVKNGNLYNEDGKKLSINHHHGYARGAININSKIQSLWVHQLAAYQKYKEKIFLVGVMVRHKNSIPSDNFDKNLLIGSGRDNSLDRPRSKRIAMARHAASFLRKLNMRKAQEIRRKNSNGIGYKKLSKMYGVSKSCIRHVVIEKTYKRTRPSSIAGDAGDL